MIPSPLTGAQGNREFLVDLARGESPSSPAYMAAVDDLERNAS